MSSVILMVLAALILYIAFRYLKVSAGNSAGRSEDTAVLPDGANDETSDLNDSADDSGNDGDSSGSGGDN